jgi:hypothetical protein
MSEHGVTSCNTEQELLDAITAHHAAGAKWVTTHDRQRHHPSRG